MWKALDREPHSVRLRGLLARFRAQEMSMTTVLHDLQAELEHWHRETSFLQMHGARADLLLQRCTELQAECDSLATELVHVRMAISGAGEELADYEGRLLHAGSGELQVAPA